MKRSNRNHSAVLGGFVMVLASLMASSLNAQPQPLVSSDITPAMQVLRNGSRPSQPGPVDWFTGSVRIDPLYTSAAPSRVGAASVTFEPGARTAWHVHPFGQILVVTVCAGWTQVDGQPKVEIRAGDVVWCPPGQRHWHGATTTTAMSHIAIQEAKDGTPVRWMEKVTDVQYDAPVNGD